MRQIAPVETDSCTSCKHLHKFGAWRHDGRWFYGQGVHTITVSSKPKYNQNVKKTQERSMTLLLMRCVPLLQTPGFHEIIFHRLPPNPCYRCLTAAAGLNRTEGTIICAHQECLTMAQLYYSFYE